MDLNHVASARSTINGQPARSRLACLATALLVSASLATAHAADAIVTVAEGPPVNEFASMDGPAVAETAAAVAWDKVPARTNPPMSTPTAPAPALAPLAAKLGQESDANAFRRIYAETNVERDALRVQCDSLRSQRDALGLVLVVGMMVGAAFVALLRQRHGQPAATPITARIGTASVSRIVPATARIQFTSDPPNPLTSKTKRTQTAVVTRR